MKVFFATSEMANFMRRNWRSMQRGYRARCVGTAQTSACCCLASRQCSGRRRICAVIRRLPGRASIPPCRLGEVRIADGLTVYLVLAPTLYQRRGSPYCRPDGAEWADNDLRFARLSLAAAQIAQGHGGLGWQPDVLHVNDWPGGFAELLRWDGATVATVMTVHNIAHQGVFSADHRHAFGIR